MKKHWTYVIKSEEGKFYIGYTENLKRRLIFHNSGKSKWTSRYKNWKLIYSKVFDNKTDARKWELYLKRQKGGNGFYKIIASPES